MFKTKPGNKANTLNAQTNSHPLTAWIYRAEQFIYDQWKTDHQDLNNNLANA